VLDPLKVVLTNYPEGEVEMVAIENNPENEAMGSRMVPFSRELYVERDDFMENPPGKFFRLSPGREVRLKGAYFITCDEAVKDDNGNIIELRCTYDPQTRSGSGFAGRKVKGTLHWVSVAHATPITAHLYDTLVLENDDDDSIQTDDAPTDEMGEVTGSAGTLRLNPNSLVVAANAMLESYAAKATADDRFQFMRNGYFCLDEKHTNEQGKPVFNRIVSLRNTYKPE